MDKYKRYYGIIAFIGVVAVLLLVSYNLIVPKINDFNNKKSQVEKMEKDLAGLQSKLQIVKRKIEQIKNSIMTSQKKIYYPLEADLGNDTLFFTLYSDLVEMVHANSVKIKSIEYTPNPDNDNFVKFGKDVYFVCDVDMELVSNYVNLGKLIQDIYQYPYYIKINNLSVRPYEKDKKILLSTLSLRLYAHTEPEEQSAAGAGDVAVDLPMGKPSVPAAKPAGAKAQ